MTPRTCWRSATAATPPTFRSKMSPAARRGWHSTTTATRSIPSTVARPGCWCRTCTSGRAPNGCAAWTCATPTSRASGRPTATTCMETHGGNSATRATDLANGAVTSVTRETSSVCTIGLDLPDWLGHRAGQHVDVRLTAEDGYTAKREYSIASAPGEPLAITVERWWGLEATA